MISDNEFLQFIHDDFSEDTLESRVKAILDAELEKTEDEMNADLIDDCLLYLMEIEKNALRVDEEGTGDSYKKIKGAKLGKVLLIAAIILVLIIGTFSASAAIFNVNIVDGIIELYEDHIKIRYDKSANNANGYDLSASELMRALESDNFSLILLPECLLAEHCGFSDVAFEKTDSTSTAHFDFYDSESALNGYIVLTRYTDSELYAGMDYLHAKNFTEISANGITVYVLEQDEKISIGYIHANVQYDIILSTDIDTALSIAKTIK